MPGYPISEYLTHIARSQLKAKAKTCYSIHERNNMSPSCEHSSCISATGVPKPMPECFPPYLPALERGPDRSLPLKGGSHKSGPASDGVIRNVCNGRPIAVITAEMTDRSAPVSAAGAVRSGRRTGEIGQMQSGCVRGEPGRRSGFRRSSLNCAPPMPSR